MLDTPRLILVQTVYVTMVMYGPTAYLTKVSLLWIMTRVFKPFRKSVVFIYVFLGVMLAYYIPAVIVKIRICNPISKFWAPSTPGSCLDQNSIILADAVVSVVSDMIILVLPLPLTLRLQLPMKKKMRVMGILGAGGLACASSVIRLALIVVGGAKVDATIAFMRVNMCGYASFLPLGLQVLLDKLLSRELGMPKSLSASSAPVFLPSLPSSRTFTMNTRPTAPRTAPVRTSV